MYEEIIKTWQDLVFCPCEIKTLDNTKGYISSVCISYKGVEFQVRYYIDGEQRTEWFQCFEIIITGKSAQYQENSNE